MIQLFRTSTRSQIVHARLIWRRKALCWTGHDPLKFDPLPEPVLQAGWRMCKSCAVQLEDLEAEVKKIREACC